MPVGAVIWSYLAVVALFFGLHFHGADFGTALVLLAVASVSFVGLGMMTAVLPLISPEKGAQIGFRASDRRTR